MQKEKGATVLFYAIREKNLDLLKTLCQTKTNMILSQCILDDADVSLHINWFTKNKKTTIDIKWMCVV